MRLQNNSHDSMFPTWNFCCIKSRKSFKLIIKGMKQCLIDAVAGEVIDFDVLANEGTV